MDDVDEEILKEIWMSEKLDNIDYDLSYEEFREQITRGIGKDSIEGQT